MIATICPLAHGRRSSVGLLCLCCCIACCCVCAVEQSGGDTVDALPVRSVEYPPGFIGKSRRSSVSAESDRPAAGSQVFTKRVIPKTPEAMDRIRTAVGKSILFSGLEEGQKQDVRHTQHASTHGQQTQRQSRQQACTPVPFADRASVRLSLCCCGNRSSTAWRR